MSGMRMLRCGLVPLLALALAGAALCAARAQIFDPGSLRQRLEFLDSGDSRLVPLKALYNRPGQGFFLRWDQALVLSADAETRGLAVPGLAGDGEQLLLVELSGPTGSRCWFFGVRVPDDGAPGGEITVSLYDSARRLVARVEGGRSTTLAGPAGACDYCLISSLAAAYAVIADSWVLCGGTGWVSCTTYMVGVLESAVDILVWCGPACE